MTLRYAHLAPGRLRDAVSRLDKVFGTIEESNGHVTEASGDRPRSWGTL